MFEQAARQKFRFDSSRGLLTVEDLWDIPLSSTSPTRANLDDIARGLHRRLRNDEDVSFVEPDRKSDATVQTMFDLVKRVIEVRLAENAAARSLREKAEKKQQLLSILKDRELDAFKTMPVDELRKAIEAL